MGTNDKFTQQGLTILNGDECPQKACLRTLYLRAIIGANNKTSVMRGE